MIGEPTDVETEEATLDDLEADIDLVDAAMTHVVEGNLDAADAAMAALAGSPEPDAVGELPDAQGEDGESDPDQPFRPAS